jgi:hypothetical protein
MAIAVRTTNLFLQPQGWLNKLESHTLLRLTLARNTKAHHLYTSRCREVGKRAQHVAILIICCLLPFGIVIICSMILIFLSLLGLPGRTMPALSPLR